jgi:hypothetical protein
MKTGSNGVPEGATYPAEEDACLEWKNGRRRKQNMQAGYWSLADVAEGVPILEDCDLRI